MEKRGVVILCWRVLAEDPQSPSDFQHVISRTKEKGRMFSYLVRFFFFNYLRKRHTLYWLFPAAGSGQCPDGKSESSRARLLVEAVVKNNKTLYVLAVTP